MWLFSSGPVGDPSRKLVQKMGADPVHLQSLRTQTNACEHRIFAGKLIARDGGFAQRVSLRVFRGLMGDFRDWAAIEEWAREIADALLGVDRASRSADQTAPVGSG